MKAILICHSRLGLAILNIFRDFSPLEKGGRGIFSVFDEMNQKIVSTTLIKSPCPLFLRGTKSAHDNPVNRGQT